MGAETLSPASDRSVELPRLASRAVFFRWTAVAISLLVAVVLAIVPVLRIFFRVEINYNEGWNVYNAAAVSHHLALYGPPRYAWTTVNYPALSFYVIAWLHGLGFGYLATGRVLSAISLLASVIFIALIVWKLTRNLPAALFGALFGAALFCTAGFYYVGMDDPQIFAQMFFLAGLFVYVSSAEAPSFWRVAAVALLFIIGGNIKHNLVEFPLAVLFDLWLVDRKRAAQFIGISIVLVAFSVAANIWAGGALFIYKMLSPRAYSLHHAAGFFMEHGFLPIQVPLAVALLWGSVVLRNARLRVIAILFWLALIVGFIFGGGNGVAENDYFDLYVAVSIIAGLATAWFWQGGAAEVRRFDYGARAVVPLILLASLAAALPRNGVHFRRALASLKTKQAAFTAEVSFLRALPGPAICESLLRCYESGKPYLFDPFNATSLINLHKLDSQPLVRQLENGGLGAIQLDEPAQSDLHWENPDIAPQFAAAVLARYKLAFSGPRCFIYVPR